jgi:peptide/nickel transport system permease protein
MMRFLDLLMAIPAIFLILTIQIILTPNIVNVMVVIGLTGWMGVARLVRAEVLSIKERLFVKALKARNVSEAKIVVKHILPHTAGPIIVAATLGIGNAILSESVLSFLGLGVQPPNPSWGNMLENSLAFMQDAPWMTIVPGAFITITVLAFNDLGDRLRYMLNARENEG